MTRRRSVVALIVGVLVVSGLAGAIVSSLTRNRRLRCVVLDVGQGDSILCEAPTGEQLLVDGGPSNAVLAELGRAMAPFDRSLDVVVLTHPDADHVTGLVEVARRYSIGTVLLTGVAHDSVIYRTFLEVLNERQVPLRIPTPGDRIVLQDDVTFTVLAPTESWEGRESDVVNNTSIVGRLDYRTFSLLLTGDAEAVVESDLVRRGAPLAADVLKVGHHGSKTSSSEAFLDAVHPTAALISVGAENRYGHPSDNVLERFRDRHVDVHRTDREGALVLESDGETFTITAGLGFRFW